MLPLATWWRTDCGGPGPGKGAGDEVVTAIQGDSARGIVVEQVGMATLNESGGRIEGPPKWPGSVLGGAERAQEGMRMWSGPRSRPRTYPGCLVSACVSQQAPGGQGMGHLPILSITAPMGLETYL